MLGSIGFLSGGSRVIVPNIVGISTSAATTALSNVGLTLGSSTGSTGTGATSENNGYVASQSVASGADADRETTITYTTYSYTPSSNPPSWTDSTISNSFTSGTAYSDSVSATNSPNYQIVQPLTGTYGTISGIGINGSTGAITGTPTVGGQTYNFRIMAYNNDGTIFTQDFSGTVGSTPTPQLTLAVSFATPSSSTSLTGSVTADNTTATTYTVSVSTNAGSISSSSFSAPSNSTTISPFTITGLSGSQTATVTATVSGVATNSNSATTTASLTYRFSYQSGGYPTALSGESVSSEGNFQASGPQIGTTVYVNAGNCGSNGIDVQAPTYYYWRCFVK
jgi:hypothetical protein